MSKTYLLPNSNHVEVHRKNPSGAATARSAKGCGCLRGDLGCCWDRAGTGQQSARARATKGCSSVLVRAMGDSPLFLARSRFWLGIGLSFRRFFSIQWSLEEETPNLLILLNQCLVFYWFYLRFKNLSREILLLKSVDLLNEDKVFTFSWVSVNCFSMKSAVVYFSIYLDFCLH